MKEPDHVPQKTFITLVSNSQAKEGFIFIHKGSASKCEGCKYFHVCVKNLETGRIYKVLRLREKRVQCELAETGMTVVEVAECEVEAAVLSKQAIEGVIISYQRRNCQAQDCEFLEQCSPKGLLDGDRCEVVKVSESGHCLLGFPLVKASLRRVLVS